MKATFFFILFLMCTTIYAQDSETVAMISTSGGQTNHKITRMSNSELPDIAFIIDSNLEDNKLRINTNYTSNYKVRFLGYYGGSKLEVKNLHSNSVIDISDYKEKVFIMNITDDESGQLLTTQVVNLKRRN